MLKIFLLCLLPGLFLSCYARTSPAKPNILWITIEDWSPDLSCYGTKGLQTPHVDKLAPYGSPGFSANQLPR